MAPSAGRSTCQTGPWPQRTVGAAPHPVHDDVDVGLEPDRHRLVGNPPPGILPHEGAAAGRQHRRPCFEKAGDHPRLAVAKIRFAIGVENIRDRHAVGQLDLGIGVDEGNAELLGEKPPDRGFSRPHQSDKDKIALTQRNARLVFQAFGKGQNVFTHRPIHNFFGNGIVKCAGSVKTPLP